MAQRRSPDPIKAAARKAKAQRKVGEGAVCTTCGEARPEALEAGTKPRICAECRRRRQRKKTTDAHHVAGRKNSPVTIDVPVNDHRELNTAQNAWPPRTLQNPDGSPLLAAAGCIRGAADTIAYLIERFLIWIADMLEQLETLLRDRIGSQWWIGTTIEAFAP